jgi:hypothetical protein
VGEDGDFYLRTTDQRSVILSASLIPESRSDRLELTELLNIKRGVYLEDILCEPPESLEKPERYRKRTLPATPLK